MAKYTRHELALGRREALRRGLPVPKGVRVVETSSGRLIYVDRTGKAFPQDVAASLNRAARNRNDTTQEDENRWTQYKYSGIPVAPADIRAIAPARGRRGVRQIIDAINSGGVPPDIEREYITAARRMAGLGATAYREPVVFIDRSKTFRWQPLARPKPRVITDAWEPEDTEAWEISTGQEWSTSVGESLRSWMGMLGLRSPIPQSPARLAARLFQGFLQRPLAYVPWDHAVLCANVVEPYYIDQPRYDDYPLKLDRIVVSDLNCAYGAILRTLPDLSDWRGRWRRVTGYAGPWGIYQTESGPQAGCMIEPRGHTVEWGWVWDDGTSNHINNLLRTERIGGNLVDRKAERTVYSRVCNIQSPNFGGRDLVCTNLTPFSQFVDWCYAAHGPFPKLMRRLPVYFVGKCAEAEEPDRGTMKAGGHYYPVVWVWVTQLLKLEMARVAKASGAHMAYIDAIHTRGELGARRIVSSDRSMGDHNQSASSNGDLALPNLYGTSIGQWKIQHEGPAVYWGLNHYAVDCRVHGRICYKHQGLEE